MRIGAALVLIALGAILRFAIAAVSTNGVDLHTVGDILMIVGALGAVLWLVVWAPWARGRRSYSPRIPLEEEEHVYRSREPY
jgi:4-amino-4-deoxy-L-arabinose transferase-like glycosyltransferase